MKAKIYFLSLIMFFFCITFLNGQTNNLDENKYESVEIGEQEWMNKNLDVSTFKNGNVIPYAKTKQEWDSLNNKAFSPAWCYYDFDTTYSEYGKFYNRYTIIASSGLAPEGWHIPSKSEWITLIDFMGGQQKAYVQLTDSTLFNALPGGFVSENGSCGNIKNKAYWWTGTTTGTMGVYYVYIEFDLVTKNITNSTITTVPGLNVRCVKD
jgi:uncharacterized protein (TIGR02145 family)